MIEIIKKNKLMIVQIAAMIFLTTALVRNTIIACDFRYRYYYFAILIMTVLILISTTKKVNFTLFLIWILTIVFFNALLDKGYFPIDEASHFDYINHIVNYKKLPICSDYMNLEELRIVNYPFNSQIPGALSYEAVQAPFYYIFMAVIGGAISNLTIRFLVIRIMGISGILVALYCLNRIAKLVNSYYKSIYHRGYIENSYLRCLAIFLILQPGLLISFTRITNEWFLMLVFSLIIWLTIQLVLKRYDSKIYFILSVLCAMAVLTKTTGIYCLGILAVLSVYYKKLKNLFLSFLLVFLICSPWLLFNYKMYHALTAMKEHLAFVLPIVNPDNSPIDAVQQIFHLMSMYFLPEGVGSKNSMDSSLMTFFSVLFVILFVVGFLQLVSGVCRVIKNKFKFDYSNEEKFWLLKLIYCYFFVVCILTLIAGTISTRINALRGRYMYSIGISIVFMLYISSECLSAKAKKVFMVLIALYLSMLFINCGLVYSDAIREQILSIR